MESIQSEKRKWYEFKKMSRAEYGKTAVLGLLAGFVFSSFGGSIVLEVFGGVLALAGLICGLVWIVLTIKEKSKK